MKGLNESLKFGQEEVIGAGEAEGSVDRIVACGLGYLSVGQVPERIRGRAQLGRVARNGIASFIVDCTCDRRDIGCFAGLEETSDGIRQSYAVNHGCESSHSATECQVLEDPSLVSNSQKSCLIRFLDSPTGRRILGDSCIRIDERRNRCALEAFKLILSSSAVQQSSKLCITVCKLVDTEHW